MKALGKMGADILGLQIIVGALFFTLSFFLVERKMDAVGFALLAAILAGVVCMAMCMDKKDKEGTALALASSIALLAIRSVLAGSYIGAVVMLCLSVGAAVVAALFVWERQRLRKEPFLLLVISALPVVGAVSYLAELILEKRQTIGGGSGN